MKKIPGLLSVLAILCLSGLITPAVAQSDEVSLIQLTDLLSTVGVSVRGISDDGRRIVFESINDYTGNNTDLNNEIFVYDLDLRRIIQITDTKDVPVDPMDSSKGVLIRVSNNAPAISGDGTRIVFSSNSGTLAGANDDGNQEIFLATLPRLSTSVSFSRITETDSSQATPIGANAAFDNYTPTINFDGTLIAFVSTRNVFKVNGTPITVTNGDNADGNAEIFLYRAGAGQFTQVTRSRDEDATVNFVVKGFNSNPFLSGNGQRLIFLSGFNYPGTNANQNTDFNGEVFLYNVGDTHGAFTQITNTTGTAIVPVLNLDGTFSVAANAPVNRLTASTRPLNRDGTLLVLESAGNFNNNNSDLTREIWLYNITTKAFTRITNQTVSQPPTQDELKRIDHSFLPSINATGTFITFGSVLNLIDDPNDSKDGNTDGSREVFRADIRDLANLKFRQVTFTQPLAGFFDQRDNLISPHIDNTGNQLLFATGTDLIGTNQDASPEIFRAIIRPITSINSQAVALANAASFDGTVVARGSIVAAFGTMLANSTASTPSADLPFDLDGVTVTVGFTAARLLFISERQINFVFPAGIAAADSVTFTVNNNGVLSTGTIKVADAAPGVFTITGNGTGPAAAQCGRVSDDGKSFEITPLPCDVGNEASFNTLILYGTGWRFASGTTVRFKLGVDANGDGTEDEVTLTPSFFGPQPTFFGLDQINVTLSKDLAAKINIETLVVAASGSANPTSQANVRTSYLPSQGAVMLANAASFDSTAVARDSIAAAFGTNLANATIVAPSNDLPFELGGVSVKVAGIAARVAFVSPTQVNFIVPTGISPADQVAVANNNNGTISTGRVKVTDIAPGLLTVSGSGSGNATAQCGMTLPDNTVVLSPPPCSVGTSAAPKFLVLYGTGWRNASSVKVTIGGIELTTTFVGPQPGVFGVDQINATLVPELAGRADAEIIVTAMSGTITATSQAGVRVSFSP